MLVITKLLMLVEAREAGAERLRRRVRHSGQLLCDKCTQRRVLLDEDARPPRALRCDDLRRAGLGSERAVHHRHRKAPAGAIGPLLQCQRLEARVGWMERPV